MASFSENTNAVSSMIRTILALAVVGVLGYGGYLGYDRFIAPEIAAQRETEIELRKTKDELTNKLEELAIAAKKVEQQSATIDKQRVTISEKSETIAQQVVEIDELELLNAKLETAMRLLKIDHLVAEVKVLKVGKDEATEESFVEVEFTERSPDGTTLGKPRVFRLRGEEIHVDAWIVKFEDHYIEEANLHRGTSLCVFKSIFGDLDGVHAYQLEERYSRPTAYARGSKLSDLEKKIWNDFWDISNDPKRAEDLGIRANHGQTTYVKAIEGATYEIDLRASDGISIHRLKKDAAPDKPTG